MANITVEIPMNHTIHSILAQASRQFLGIACLELLSVLCVANCQAQISWNIVWPDSSANYVFDDLSCSGNTCSAFGHRWHPESGLNKAIFWRSDDAGRSWRVQDPNLPSNYFPPSAYPWSIAWNSISVDQIDSLHTVSVGLDGLILSTSNGGATWVKENSPVSSGFANADCYSPREGMIVGSGPPVILIRGLEGPWTIAPFAPQRGIPAVRIWGHSYGHGKYCVLCSPYVSNAAKPDPIWLYSTSNSWQSVDSVEVPFWPKDSLITGLYYANFNFGSGDTMIVSGVNRQLNSDAYIVFCRSFDGGKNWQRTLYNPTQGYVYIRTARISNEIILSSRTLQTTVWSTDVGSTWQTDTMLFDKDFLDFSRVWFKFATTSDGSIVGAFGGGVGTNILTALGRAKLPTHSDVKGHAQTVGVACIYPNPTTGYFHVGSLHDPVTILDPLGRLYRVPVNENALDVSRLPNGVYFITDGRNRTKFVKE